MWGLFSKFIYFYWKVRKINIKNIIEIINLADKHSAQELKSSAIKYVIQNKQKVF